MPEVEAPPKPPQKIIGKGLSVLLIDDMEEKEIIFQFAFRFENIQAELVFCRSLTEAVKAIRQRNKAGKPFNAVLLDKNAYFDSQPKKNPRHEGHFARQEVKRWVLSIFWGQNCFL